MSLDVLTCNCLTLYFFIFYEYLRNLLRGNHLRLQRQRTPRIPTHLHQQKLKKSLLQSIPLYIQFKVTRPKFYLIKPDQGYCDPNSDIKVSVTLHQDVPYVKWREFKKHRETSSNFTTSLLIKVTLQKKTGTKVGKNNKTSITFATLYTLKTFLLNSDKITIKSRFQMWKASTTQNFPIDKDLRVQSSKDKTEWYL